MRVACVWFDRPAPTQKIAELFLRFSPEICIRQDQAIFVEIGKCAQLYSEASFKARAHVLLQRNNFSARIGVANHILEALGLTLFNKTRIEELPLTALLELVDPFNRDPIIRKSVQNLIKSFQDLGVKNLGHFKKIPSSELIGRFGVIGKHCFNRAHMLDSISWPIFKPEEVILEKKEFPYFEFYGELDPILFELKSQLDSIFSRLFSRRKRALKLQVLIKCEQVSTHPNYLRKLDFDFFSPQGSSKGCLKILKERLTREFEKRPILSPIESIETKVVRTVHFDPAQREIFNSDEDRLEDIHSIHNQLIEMMGGDNVFQAVLVEDRRPEKSWKKKFDLPHEPLDLKVNIADIIPERPTYLCRRPIKIEVTAGYLHIQKRRYRIIHWDNNVEKITGGWFENPVPEIQNSYDRNYYHVVIEGFQKVLVFENPLREFYLHGYYG